MRRTSRVVIVGLLGVGVVLGLVGGTGAIAGARNADVVRALVPAGASPINPSLRPADGVLRPRGSGPRAHMHRVALTAALRPQGRSAARRPGGSVRDALRPKGSARTPTPMSGVRAMARQALKPVR